SLLRLYSRGWLRFEREPSDSIRAKIDGDHDLRPHGAAERNRDGIHDAPVDQIATLAQYGSEQTRYGTGSSNGVRHVAVAEPNLLSGRKVGGDRCKRHRQLGKRALDKLALIQIEQAVAFEQAAPQPHIGKSDDAFPVEG